MMNDRRFNVLLWRTVLVPVLALVAVSLLLAWAIRGLLAEADSVRHTDEVLNRAHEVLKLGVDMETGVRGFQITGDPALLQPYEEALRIIEPKFDDLAGRLIDPTAHAHQARAREALSTWMNHAREVIRLRTNGEDTQNVAINLQGKLLFDRFRAAFDDFIGVEHSLRKSRAATFAQTHDRLLPLWLCLLVGLAGGIGWYTRRQMAAAADIFRRSEEVARQRAEEFEAIFEHASVGVVQVATETGRFLRCNRSYCSMVGYTAAELIDTLTPLDLTHPDDREGRREAFARLLRGEVDNYISETRYLRHDGSVIWVSVMASLIRDRAGRPLRTVGVIVDLTARRAAEAALRSSEDRLRLATEGAGVGIWDWDITTGALEWSERCKVLFNLPPELPVTYDAFLASLDGEDRERVTRAVLGATNPAGSGRYEAEMRTRDQAGNVRWLSSRGSVRFEGAERRPVRFSGSAVDITELKEAEARLRGARDELEQKVEERTRALAIALEKAQEVDRLKSEFLATMSHELRTPLNSVIGFTELLKAGIPGPVNEEQQRQLGFVHRSGQHLLQLINDLLDLARIESGRVTPSWDVFAPETVIREALGTIRPLAAQKGLHLDTQLDLPPTIRADRKMFFQVLLNLLSNAIKFTDKGEIVLSSRVAAETLVVSVRDTGIGIKPRELERLFEAFRQVDGSAQRRYQGTGLGLYLCKKIVTLLGGTIRGESEFGRGSVFSFTLPLPPPP